MIFMRAEIINGGMKRLSHKNLRITRQDSWEDNVQGFPLKTVTRENSLCLRDTVIKNSVQKCI